MSRILVVDDDAELRTLLRVALTRNGYSVNEAANGREGMHSFEQEPPDLVVCDVYMPEMDGFEVIRTLRRDFKGAKIVAISGGSNVRRHLDPLLVAQRLGADSILDKPFPMSELLYVTERLLALR